MSAALFDLTGRQAVVTGGAQGLFGYQGELEGKL